MKVVRHPVSVKLETKLGVIEEREGSQMKKRDGASAFVLTVGLALIGICRNAHSQCGMDTQKPNEPVEFVVSGGYVKMPVGAFLLIRKNTAIGAIHLTKLIPGGTEMEGKSSFETYFQGDGTGSLTAVGVAKQTGDLDLQPLKGPGRGLWIYQPGQNLVHIGKWPFLFAAPNLMGMSPVSTFHGPGDHGYEFAPTSACNVSEINAHDKRLRWFRFDANASVTLPLADLPK